VAAISGLRERESARERLRKARHEHAGEVGCKEAHAPACSTLRHVNPDGVVVNETVGHRVLWLAVALVALGFALLAVLAVVLAVPLVHAFVDLVRGGFAPN
jgi:hypothetical protein